MVTLRATTRGLAFAAVLAVSTSMAFAAHTNPGKPPAGGVQTQLAFDGKTCSPEERAAITEAFGAAQDRVAKAIRLVREQPNHAHVRNWFGDAAPVRRVGAALEAVAQGLARPGGFRISCHTGRCSNPSPIFAYAIPAQAALGFCGTFFRTRLTGADSRLGTVVHEVSHIVAGSDDHAYGHADARALARKDGAKAAQNADNLEYFVEGIED